MHNECICLRKCIYNSVLQIRCSLMNDTFFFEKAGRIPDSIRGFKQNLHFSLQHTINRICESNCDNNFAFCIMHYAFLSSQRLDKLEFIILIFRLYMSDWGLSMERPSEFTKQTCIIVTFAYTAPPLYAKLKTRTRPAEKIEYAGKSFLLCE